MPKRSETIAVVFVDKDWYDQTLRFLIDETKSQSTVGVHRLQGPLKDASHPAGLWLKGIGTRRVKKDADVAMDFMIPWRYVVGFGVVEDPAAEGIGFRSEAVTEPGK